MRKAGSILDRTGNAGGSAGSPEVLYRTRRTRISRIRFPGHAGTIVCKKPLGPDAARRLRHETRILERLAGVEGTPQIASGARIEGSLAMLDVGGVPMAHVLRAQPLATSELLDIALALAQTVAAIHARGVLHKDLNPDNILLAGPERRVAVIDFDLATTYTQERPDFTHHQRIAGTLPYLAPEMTGRSGRLVDQRSDLYALGVTLYELATGRLPFAQHDALQLIHDHLVRTPRTPANIDRSLPPALSAMIMRLLEKEPDRRYQGAEGLAYDLIRLKDALAQGTSAFFPLAEHDFPSILLAPSRLIGRDAERATLRAAFEKALISSERAVFVTGSPGVGKTVLVDSLKTVATEHRGWFVKGKFDQVQQGAAGLRQALGALGRLLLAEPENELAAHRLRIARALGPRASHLTDLIPEFAIILGRAVPEGPSEPLDADVQIRQAMLDLFRAVASPAQPLVVFLDDVQWAGMNALGLIDAVVTDESLRGLLIVGSYRNADVAPDHPLARTFARWASLGTSPQQLHLLNLDPTGLRQLLAEILRLPPAQAVRLAEAIGSRTDGNPFDTLELVNALRRDGILVAGSKGWNWDDVLIRRYIGAHAVVDFIAVRIARLASGEVQALRTIACLGSDVETEMLATALGADSAEILDRLEAALEDGLLLPERDGTIRFSHDRVQQAAYESLGESERIDLHLAIGRRLAKVDRFATAAAEQYVSAVARVSGPGEARDVIGLFTRAAEVARLSTSYAEVERFAAAAITLLEKIVTPGDRALMNQLQSERHAALYSLARYAEGDVVYRAIERNDPNLLALASTACVQICSLANRGLQAEAVAIGRDLLARLGMQFPGAEIASEVELGLDTLQAWIDAGMPSSAQVAPLADPTLLLVARLTARIMPSAFFSDPMLSYWLGLKRRQLWLDNGCPPALATGLVGNAIALIGLRGDYRRAYRLARYACTRVTDVSEPDASRTRHVFALAAAHWGEPLEATVAYAEHARVGLIAAGDVQFACYTYYASLPARLECAPTLDGVIAEADSAIAFALRTNSVQVTTSYISYRTLANELAGKREVSGAGDAPPRGLPLSGDVKPSRITKAIVHINSALVAAIFQDDAELASNTAAAMLILPDGFYVAAVAQTLRAFALAQNVRTRISEHLTFARELRELDACLAWIVSRAADAAQNFAHLARFIEAERAWATGDFARAATAFDAALRAGDAPERPWHRALISERAGIFFIETGLERAAGRALIEEARQRYADWGASAKVEQLEERHSFLKPVLPDASADARQTTLASADSLDLLAILRGLPGA